MDAGKPIIGLAGGIGAGKSTVASILAELGAAVISSDRLNHEILDSPEVIKELRRWWGERVVRPDGGVDRDAVRGLIAADPEARRRLEGLVHPLIARRRVALTASYQADAAVRAVVWDSPLLYEAGLAPECTCVIFVEADPELRRARLARHRGWTFEELQRLESAQKPLDFKRQNADYRVVNNSDEGVLRREVENVFSQILSGA